MKSTARRHVVHAQQGRGRVQGGLDRPQGAGAPVGRAAAGDRARRSPCARRPAAAAGPGRTARAAGAAPRSTRPGVLARSNPGSSTSASSATPASSAAATRSSSSAATSAHHVVVVGERPSSWARARVWVITSAAPELGAHGGQGRLGQSRDVVEHGRAGIQRRLRGARAPGVHGHGHAGVGQPPHQRHDPLGLLLLGHRLAVGAPGLAAHVDDVGALASTSAKARSASSPGVLGALAVRERVGRRVHDAHDQRRALRHLDGRAGPARASCRLGDGLAGHQALQRGDARSTAPARPPPARRPSPAPRPWPRPRRGPRASPGAHSVRASSSPSRVRRSSTSSTERACSRRAANGASTSRSGRSGTIRWASCGRSSAMRITSTAAWP